MRSLKLAVVGPMFETLATALSSRTVSSPTCRSWRMESTATMLMIGGSRCSRQWGATRLVLRAVLELGTPRCGWCRREQCRGQETWTGLGPFRGTVRFAPAHRLLRGHQKWELHTRSSCHATRVHSVVPRVPGLPRFRGPPTPELDHAAGAKHASSRNQATGTAPLDGSNRLPPVDELVTYLGRAEDGPPAIGGIPQPHRPVAARQRRALGCRISCSWRDIVSLPPAQENEARVTRQGTPARTLDMPEIVPRPSGRPH